MISPWPELADELLPFLLRGQLKEHAAFLKSNDVGNRLALT